MDKLNAKKAICIFSPFFQFDPLMIESKKAATVVLMLNSDEDEVLAKACEAVYKFADKCKLIRFRNSWVLK